MAVDVKRNPAGQITDVAIFGNVRVGHFFEPFSLARLTSNRYQTFMERPLLDAFAGQHGFADQKARLRGSELGMLDLTGIPLFDDLGRFAGFRGTASRAVDKPAPEPIASTASQPKGPDESFGPEIGKVLKSPLDRIIANADIIREQVDGPLRRGYADYAADIAAAGRHLMSLVDDLVELQTIERPDFHPDPERIDLCDVARRAAGLLAVRAADADVSIDPPDLDEELPATGEFRRVLQILVNLIGNAVRHSPPGGMVWLRAEREGPFAIMIVADQGGGIASQDHERIFEKFERLGRSDHQYARRQTDPALQARTRRPCTRLASGQLRIHRALPRRPPASLGLVPRAGLQPDRPRGLQP